MAVELAIRDEVDRRVALLADAGARVEVGASRWEEIRAVHAELRLLAQRARDAELAGRPEVDVRRRCAELERTIRARSWQVTGTGEHRAEVTFAQVRADLAAHNSVLVCFLILDGVLRALELGARSSRLVELGDAAPVAESVARLHSDLDALCGRRFPAAIPI